MRFSRFSHAGSVITRCGTGPRMPADGAPIHTPSARGTGTEVTEEVYEAPMLSETGDFAEVTLGWP
jgi:hypothetical protein